MWNKRGEVVSQYEKLDLNRKQTFGVKLTRLYPPKPKNYWGIEYDSSQTFWQEIENDPKRMGDFK